MVKEELRNNPGHAPTVRNSANKAHHGRITKKGNKLVRYVLVEAVHRHTRFASNSKFTQFCMRI